MHCDLRGLLELHRLPGDRRSVRNSAAPKTAPVRTRPRMGPCLTHACARDHRFAGNSCRHVDLGKKALDKEALDAHTVSAEGAVPSPYPRPPPRGTWTALLRGSAARALDATVARRPGRQLLSVRRALVKLPAGCTPGTCLHLAAPDSAGDPQRTIYRVVVPSLATSFLWAELPPWRGWTGHHGGCRTIGRPHRGHPTRK